jgi:hypothetical protein
MHATIRRYEGAQTGRAEEVGRKAGETLVPKLQKLEGFGGYYLIEAEDAVFSSFALFESRAQAHEATMIAAAWVRDEGLESALPNRPTITTGKVIAQVTR